MDIYIVILFIVCLSISSPSSSPSLFQLKQISNTSTYGFSLTTAIMFAKIAARTLAASFTLGAGALAVSQVEAASKKPNLKKAKEMIGDIIGDMDVINPSCDDGAQGGGGGVGPMLLRLAWHSSGTYDVKAKNGGSDGATMRFSEGAHGGNAGLQHARALMEPVKAANPEMTYADLYVLAGVVAIEEMGGPNVGFRWG
jgi:hypothetical protein